MKKTDSSGHRLITEKDVIVEGLRTAFYVVALFITGITFYMCYMHYKFVYDEEDFRIHQEHEEAHQILENHCHPDVREKKLLQLCMDSRKIVERNIDLERAEAIWAHHIKHIPFSGMCEGTDMCKIASIWFLDLVRAWTGFFLVAVVVIALLFLYQSCRFPKQAQKMIDNYRLYRDSTSLPVSIRNQDSRGNELNTTSYHLDSYDQQLRQRQSPKLKG